MADASSFSLLDFDLDTALDAVTPALDTSSEGRSELEVNSPIHGEPIGRVQMATHDDLDAALDRASDAFRAWRSVPAPRRGELVRLIGEVAREHKEELARLITLENGKIASEAEGEVQEWIDVCDYAVGLSRQLHGKTIASERPDHRMMEQWHPLGPVGAITAFNFPMAVWSWNAMVAFVCGDPVVWKPSEKTPLCALACQRVVELAAERFDGDVPDGLSTVVLGGRETGKRIASDPRLPLISATGSVRMGRDVATTVAQRLGKTLLELGGNNAAIVTPSADLDLALRGIVFAAVGTAGQRCTSLRRLLVHESRVDEVVERLVPTYGSLKIGDPRESGTLVGPLVDEASYQNMERALEMARNAGGEIVTGGDRVTEGVPSGGVYVEPAIVRIDHDADIVKEETFAPILYVCTYDDLDEAIAMNNDVPQGLSSAIFTENMREAERFLSAAGSDCGIANVNIGTSGAEIGGAFGGEKDTGGGRESGSDSWRAYMRRATNTVNYGSELPLAQGVEFDT